MKCKILSVRARNLTAQALLAGYLSFFPAFSPGAQQEDWQRSPEAQNFFQRMAAERERLVQLNGNGTNQKLKAELLAMFKTDQEQRTKGLSLPNAQQFALAQEIEKTDAALTRKLKQIVVDYGWPTISLVGLEASNAAAVILTHSPDQDFQRQLIPELQKLVEEKKVMGADIAVLIDKELKSEGKPQRFGNQFSWKEDGSMIMYPVEDPEHLEERRVAYLLPPINLYKHLMEAMYHRKVQ